MAVREDIIFTIHSFADKMTFLYQNSLPLQKFHEFAHNIFRCIFLKEKFNIWTESPFLREAHLTNTDFYLMKETWSWFRYKDAFLLV